MKKFINIMGLMVIIFGMQFSEAQVPSVNDRDIRERLSHIEEKLEGINGTMTEKFTALEGKVTEVKELLSSGAALAKWVCEGFCEFGISDRYSSTKFIRVYGSGASGMDAIKGLVDECTKLTKANNGYESTMKVFSDETKSHLAMIKNACQQE